MRHPRRRDTSLTAETGRDVTVAEVTPVLKRHLAEVLGYGTWRHVYDVGVLAGPPLEAAAPLRGAAAVPMAAR